MGPISHIRRGPGSYGSTKPAFFLPQTHEPRLLGGWGREGLLVGETRLWEPPAAPFVRALSPPELEDLLATGRFPLPGTQDLPCVRDGTQHSGAPYYTSRA